MNKQFFTELAGLLADKQELSLKIAKTGEQLTVLATVKGKHITAAGTPEEMDAEFLSHINTEVEAKTFTFAVSDKPKSEEEEEEEEDAKAEKLKESKALEKKGDELMKKKKFKEAIEKYNEANEVGEISKTLLKSLEKAKAAYNKTPEGKKAAAAVPMEKKTAPAPSIKPQPDKAAKAAVQAVVNEAKYSDDDLKKFKAIIDNKIIDAESDLSCMKMNTAAEYVALSPEDRNKLISRQEKFIKNLQDAMVRIENKTYGICRATGKLISKERLLQVPHATLSIEVKAQEDEKMGGMPISKDKVKPEQAKAPSPEPPKVEAAADNKKTVFKHTMENGKKLMSDRQYEKAEKEFAAALELFPEDEKAKLEHENAKKWVKAMNDL